MANSSARALAGPARHNRFQHERDLVEAAIALVAGGGARRVSLLIQHGALILPGAQASAGRWGVIVRAVWRPDGAGCDLIVEPIA